MLLIVPYFKEMLIPIKAYCEQITREHERLSRLLPSQQLNLKTEVNLGASLCFPAALF